MDRTVVPGVRRLQSKHQALVISKDLWACEQKRGLAWVRHEDSDEAAPQNPAVCGAVKQTLQEPCAGPEVIRSRTFSTPIYPCTKLCTSPHRDFRTAPLLPPPS